MPTGLYKTTDQSVQVEYDAAVHKILFLALFGPTAAGPSCPLLRDDRTLLKCLPTSVVDPTPTFGLNDL